MDLTLRDVTLHDKPNLWKGALAGLAAGLIASAAMNAFQSAAKAASPDTGDSGDDSGGDSEPSTVKAADKVSVAITGAPVPAEARPAAGQAVHYVTGALLGVGYGIVAEYRPETTSGFGSAFGGVVSAVLDEAVVPAAGLGAPPTQASAGSHLFGLSSHIVFGGVAEAVRRLARSALR